MIRISTFYPEPSAMRFDFDYYVNRHIPFARKLLEPYGLCGLRILRGTESVDGTPPLFVLLAEMAFDDMDGFRRGMAATGDALFADIPNYTDRTPSLQLSELVEDIILTPNGPSPGKITY